MFKKIILVIFCVLIAAPAGICLAQNKNQASVNQAIDAGAASEWFLGKIKSIIRWFESEIGMNIDTLIRKIFDFFIFLINWVGKIFIWLFETFANMIRIGLSFLSSIKF